MYRLPKNLTVVLSQRCFSTSTSRFKEYSCKLLVVGGGTGGCATAAKFSRHLKPNELIILEPAEHHYYQPLFTLIGGGICDLPQSRKPMSKVLPKNATWIQQKATLIDPKNNLVETSRGDKIKYDFLLLATGLVLNYSKIPGLVEALSIPDSGVCSNYSPDYVNRTFPILSNVESGNLVFTFPNSPVKCPGAPQKISYIAEDYMRKHGKRDKVKIYYNTSLPNIFGVKHYADCLWKICEGRDINVNLRTNLTKVDPLRKVAYFENLDKPEQGFKIEYSMLHVTPPMGTPDVLKNCKELVNEAGFVDVCPEILQSQKFKNVFAIGDCSSSPNSKTAAAAAAQCLVVYKNLSELMLKNQSECSKKDVYDGYASCPLVTGYDKCVLAEFDYNLKPLETFPFRQDKELRSMYILKHNMMPVLYWNVMLNGYWNGPKTMRKLLHLQFF